MCLHLFPSRHAPCPSDGPPPRDTCDKLCAPPHPPCPLRPWALAEDVIEQFGVVKASYEGVPLPSLEVHTVICSRLGPPKEVLRVEQVLLARELEWGQVPGASCVFCY